MRTYNRYTVSDGVLGSDTLCGEFQAPLDAVNAWERAFGALHAAAYKVDDEEVEREDYMRSVLVTEIGKDGEWGQTYGVDCSDGVLSIFPMRGEHKGEQGDGGEQIKGGG